MCTQKCCHYCDCEKIKEINIPILRVPQAYVIAGFTMGKKKIEPANHLKFENITHEDLAKIQAAMQTLSKYNVQYFQEK